MTNIEKLIREAIQSTSEKLKKHNISIHNRIMDGLAELQNDYEKINGGLRPTIDNLYRLHSPADGYIDINKEVYLKGQFLPITNVSQIIRRSSYGDVVNHSSRILTFKDVADVVLNETSGNGIIDVSLGRTFVKNDNAYVYIYFKGPRFLVNHFETVVNDIKVEREEAFKNKLNGIAPEGRKEITGRIVNISEKIDYNYNKVNRNAMIINDEGSFSVYGSLNSEAYYKASVGDVIKFRATFKQTNNKEHAFFSRMSNFEIVD